mmetsp:Transcript_21913/g.50033  ORF Transcript_21913/g.50033 Transcript_21913/m.50033 type:complete len:219 (-) Transcript_21913:72-728(-)
MNVHLDKLSLPCIKPPDGPTNVSSLYFSALKSTRLILPRHHLKPKTVSKSSSVRYGMKQARSNSCASCRDLCTAAAASLSSSLSSLSEGALCRCLGRALKLESDTNSPKRFAVAVLCSPCGLSERADFAGVTGVPSALSLTDAANENRAANHALVADFVDVGMPWLSSPSADACDFGVLLPLTAWEAALAMLRNAAPGLFGRGVDMPGCDNSSLWELP